MADTTQKNICADEKDLYQDLPFCRGQKSLPGLRAYAYYIKKSSIVAWPADQEATSLEEVATKKGDFTLAADKKWLRIELVPDQQQLQVEQAGQWGARVFKNTATLVIPGTEENASGLAAELNNDNCVFLVPQRNGKFRLLGSESFDASVKPGLDSGKGTDDSNATTLTIEVYDEKPAPFYKGKIATTDGDISGADGKPVTTTTKPGTGA